MVIVEKENFMGGTGVAHFEHIMTADEMHGMNRVYAKVTLKKGCSVGYHVHDGDGEDYFVLSGIATLDDNHERTLYLKPGEHYFTRVARVIVSQMSRMKTLYLWLSLFIIMNKNYKQITNLCKHNKQN